MTFTDSLIRSLKPTLAGVALLGLALRVDGAVLLKYEMTQATPEVQDPVQALEGGALQVGSGVGNFILPSNLAYPSVPVCVVNPSAGVLPLGNATAALAANCLVYFDVRVGAEVGSLNLQNLTFDVARGGANTNRGYGVFITTPTAVDVPVKPSTYIPTERFVWSPQTIDLSGVPGLQGLRAGDVLRVKIPFWTAESVQSVEIDNVTLHGTVQLRTNQSLLAPLVITDVQRLNDSVSLTWNSRTGSLYAVEYSVDLQQWDRFPTNIPAGLGAITSASFSTRDPGMPTNSILLQYQMGQLSPQVRDVIGVASGGSLTPGAGLAQFDVTFSGYPTSPAVLANFVSTTPDVPSAMANQSLFTFDLTVGTNITDLDLTSLSFNAARGGSSTPRGYGVYVTTPTSTNQLVQSATLVNTVRFTWEAHSVNLAGISSLQNLTAGQVVRFTLPIFSPSPISSLEFDDITVRGHYTPRPVPSYVGANAVYLRVRELEREPILVEAATTPTGTWKFYPTRTLDQMPGDINRVTDGPTSRYGGWLAFQTNATGFFHPRKIKDRWWLVDPQGYLFLHQGVAVVSTVDSPGGSAALTAKFGNANNWAVASTTLLRRSGFNGAGAWSDTSRLRAAPGPLVYTIIKNFLSTYSNTNGNPGYPQVFDPTFAPFCQNYAQSFASTQSDPYLLGYFSDNELNFPASMLTTWLELSPGNASYEEAWRWLRERYGPDATISQVTTQDRNDFLGHVWARYYSVVNQAIKLRDPNHLYLGSRLFSSDKDRPEIFRAIGPHVDVISVNHYSQWTPDMERIRMWEQESGRPVIITEFYVKGEDSGMPNNTGAGWVVRTQVDRGRFYENFVLTLLESKVCVGWHWFKYADNDPDSNPDPSNVDSNKGVVSNRYDPYPDLLDRMQRFNERTYGLTKYFDADP
ncbi:MAG TPA: hypothetical protein VFZ59_14605 [Verrucomicrobiae bacterium]|nr:hypothetical protein [Verrucomicrobiae bacterium]